MVYGGELRVMILQERAEGYVAEPNSAKEQRKASLLRKALPSEVEHEKLPPRFSQEGHAACVSQPHSSHRPRCCSYNKVRPRTQVVLVEVSQVSRLDVGRLAFVKKLHGLSIVRVVRVDEAPKDDEDGSAAASAPGLKDDLWKQRRVLQQGCRDCSFPGLAFVSGPLGLAEKQCLLLHVELDPCAANSTRYLRQGLQGGSMQRICRPDLTWEKQWLSGMVFHWTLCPCMLWQDSWSRIGVL